MKRVILTANDGMVLTNGKIYCKEVHLGAYTDPNSYYEITQDEYEAIMEDPEQAEEE